MRVAIGQFRELEIDDLIFVKQMGASGVSFNHPDFDLPSWRKLLGRHGTYKGVDTPASDHWEYMDLLRLKTMIEDQGLTLEALENVPGHFMDKIHLGTEGRDQQIEAYCKTIENMGRAGIPTLGYTFNITRVWRTSQWAPARGGATTSAFDLSRLEDQSNIPVRLSEEQVWENYTYFIQKVLPVAEKAGVKLALHPDDPPFAQLDGISRIMVGKENFKRVFEIGDSPNHGLDFCMGTFSERSVDEMYELLDYFSKRNKVFYSHVRNIKGCGNKFSECFIDEGDISIPKALNILKSNGFNGFIIDDHVPNVVNDTGFGHRARGHAAGYLMGVVETLSFSQK